MRTNIKYILIGLFLISMGVQTAAANSDYGLKIDMVAYVTPQDIKPDNHSVDVYIKVENISAWMYPINMIYIYDNVVIFNKTIESGYESFYHMTWFTVDGAPNLIFKRSKLLLTHNGIRIGMLEKGEPTYILNRDQKEFDLRVVDVSLMPIQQEGIFGFLKVDVYKSKFTVKNYNQSYAFYGTAEVGDFRVMSHLRIRTVGTIGPGMSVEIDGPIMTKQQIGDIRTEIETCSFC